jgi:zinc D-Ala-D-Ala carboxypeptidase
MSSIDRKQWKITEAEVLMDRDKQNPLTPEMRQNLEKLMVAINLVRDLYGKPLTVSSGYRPAAQNAAAGGASKSCHLTLEAVDFADADRKLTKWCLKNLDILASAGLYMESPVNTPTWVHLQTRAPASGKRIFLAR